MMMRPAKFRMNEQTAVNNYYQRVLDGLEPEEVSRKAQEEFDDFAALLHSKGVEVIVFQDSSEPDTPDAVFPNNWVSFHEEKKAVLYPMYAENRRLERKEGIFDILADRFGFEIDEIEDLSHFENDNMFLEGTGSMILDRQNKLAYAAISERTNEEVLNVFCEYFGYEPVAFRAYQHVDGQRLPIYHTNVMMCLGRGFSVICLEAIDDLRERNRVRESLKSTGKKIIEITEAQKHRFAGNMLNVAGQDGKEFCVMSKSAFGALRPDQIQAIEKHAEILYSNLDVIEACGGGSARCMIAEIFLPKSSTAGQNLN